MGYQPQLFGISSKLFFYPHPSEKKMKDKKEAIVLNISTSIVFNLKAFFFYI